MDILCPRCGKTLRFPDSAIGRTIRCPNCQFTFIYQNGVIEPVENSSDKPASTHIDSEISLNDMNQAESTNINTNPSNNSDFSQNTNYSNKSDDYIQKSDVPASNFGYQNYNFNETVDNYSFVQSRTIRPTIVNLSRVISTSWHLLTNNLSSSILALIIGGLVYLLFFIPGMILQVSTPFVEDANTKLGLEFIYLVYSIFIQMAMFLLMIGMIRFYVTIARGQQASFSLIFSGFNAFVRMFCSQILVSIIVFASSLLTAGIILAILLAISCLVPSELVDTGQFWVAAFPVSFCVAFFVLFPLFLRLILSQFLIADTNCSVLDSIKMSWIVMRGNRLRYIGLLFIMFLVLILGYISCCIGVFLAIPLVIFMSVVFYLEATGQPYAVPTIEGKEYL